jgi:hypothetical protein
MIAVLESKENPRRIGRLVVVPHNFAGMMRRTDEAKNPVQRAAIALESWRRELI